MTHYRIKIAYDGTAFSGWQKQPDKRTVQHIIEKELSVIAKQPVTILGAGRTDAGVHARGQVASFSIEEEIPETAFLKGLNSRMPNDIFILSAEKVDASFHPIRNAKTKSYCYYFCIHDESIHPALQRYVNNLRYNLDINAFKRSLSFFEGRHDFSSFCGAGSEVATKVRDIFSIEVFEAGFFPIFPHSRPVFGVRFTGNGFLKYMVRNIVGTAFEVGRGALSENKIPAIMAAKNRSEAGPTAAAHGLVLERIVYEK